MVAKGQGAGAAAAEIAGGGKALADGERDAGIAVERGVAGHMDHFVEGHFHFNEVIPPVGVVVARRG